jgi:dUTP pyrophosphatase
MERKTVTCCSKVPQSITEGFKEKASNQIKTKIVAEDGFIPQYKTEDAACCDLRAFLPEGDIVLEVGETRRIGCGFKIQMQEGYEAQIRSRSGHASKGIMVVDEDGIVVTNGVGTIDSGFRDQLSVVLTNLSKDKFKISHKDRIAQMAIKPVYYFDFEQVDELDPSERGEGGWGSTGVK